ncbi:fructokinase [Luteitalea sp. TBR-22]|uniref:ROK family protein n=1 Tax=Luteitalea sp. TBR-22 TaxID=2802971 RepID=UPI001AF07509|nr:ROK family protein [Luteitalea sp. TBR-22]BCS33153.1 fructokinase [Luteitalea sp. TBR-22]
MRIGIDLGGTKIEALALGDHGESLHRERLPTPRHDYEGTLAAIGELVRRCESATGRTGTVGVGMPGAISPATGLVKNANSTWLNRQPFAEDLQRVLGRQVRFANDANCLALSEATDGAAAGAPVVFGVILGTGVGGGLVVNGNAVIGANAVGGEWGHNMLPWPEDDEYPGPACYCGLTGCIETWLSGPAFARDFLHHAGREATAAQVLTMAEGGDAEAEAAWRRYERRLARALASLINIVDPDVIVAGGGLSNVGRLFTNVPALWEQWVFSDRVDTRFVPAMYGDSSGVRGAAWLW